MLRSNLTLKIGTLVFSAVLSSSDFLFSQLKVDSVYTIHASSHRILDVSSPRSFQFGGPSDFLFVQETDSGSKILWKSVVSEADLLNEPIVLHTDTVVLRRSHFTESQFRENEVWVTRKYLFWERQSSTGSSVMMIKRDSARWSSPRSFVQSEHYQTQLTVSTGGYLGAIGLVWVEQDSITYARVVGDSIEKQHRLKLIPGRTGRHPAVYEGYGESIVVWEERDTSSILAFARVQHGDSSVVIDTLVADGDNTLPTFAGHPFAPLLIWAKRNLSVRNLFQIYGTPDPFSYHEQITHDTVGSNSPGSVFLVPIIWRVSGGGFNTGHVFAYHRMVADSQAVVRMRLGYPGYERDELWTRSQISNVSITQGFHFTPAVFWIEEDSATFALKARPTTFFLDAVESVESPPITPLLFQNYPNPFNPSTTIDFILTQSGYVTLFVFDLLGREIATLIHGKMDTGQHRVVWDGSGLPSGIYFCRLTVGDHRLIRKMILLR